jgi:hypothetical protein
MLYITRYTDSVTHKGVIEAYKISGTSIDSDFYYGEFDQEDVPFCRPSSGALDVVDNYIYVGLWEDNGITVLCFEE